MSNLTNKQRDALPDSDFCYVKGKTRLFPIIDASDVMSAAHLIGKSPDPAGTKSCIIGKANAHKWPLPDAWKPGDSKHAAGNGDGNEGVALFGNEPAVSYRALVARAGDYPEKNIDLTPEDLLAQALETEPVPIDSGHPQDASPLDGKFGSVSQFELNPDDGSLWGVATVPKWLDELLEGTERKLSAKWHIADKKLKAVSLVMDPHVTDAALVAAFAKRHDTPEGQAVMQQVHNTAARGGAVCKQANATMSSAHESSATQQVHDIAVQHGAQCSAVGQNSGMALYSATPAEVTPVAAQSTWRKPVSWLKGLKDAFAAIPEEDAATFATGTATTPAAATAQSGTQDRSEADALRAELARERAKGIARDAATFATSIIEIKHKALPAEKDAIIAAYTQAAQDDVSYGVATFANGQSGTRVQLLTQAYEARNSTDHLLTEQIGEAAFAALANRMQTPKQDPNAPLGREELDNLLKMTSAGQSVLASRNGSHN